MPVREESFRIGCGRYLQGEGYLSRVGEEVLRLGKAPLCVGDRTCLSLVKAAVEESFHRSGCAFAYYEHNGTCNEEDAEIVAAFAREKGFDVIVGFGGGVMMDFAKLCAFFAGCPVLNVPTSSATCAAFAPLSVRYTREGKTVGSRHYENEVDGVLVDTALLLRQPVRLFLSGVFDALAKFVEIRQRFRGDLNGEYPIGLDFAYAMAEHSHRVLAEKVPAALEAMKSGKGCTAFEQVIFAAVAATGVISGIARGSNQCALGHKFYETARLLFPEGSKPYLHGEIVGVGLLLQNRFNGELERNEFLLDLMKRYGMPHTVAGVGVDPSEETMKEFETRITASSAIDDTNEEECRKFRDCLAAFWNEGANR